MDKNEIIRRITPIVRKDFENESLIVTDDMSADNTEEWTSLSFMTFLSDVENEFGFKFKMMELFNLKTMGNIIASVEKHMA